MNTDVIKVVHIPSTLSTFMDGQGNFYYKKTCVPMLINWIWVQVVKEELLLQAKDYYKEDNHTADKSQVDSVWCNML